MDPSAGDRSLSEMLREFASLYHSARAEPFRGHPVASLMRGPIAAAVRASGVFEDDEYKVSGSVGKGGWAEIPWLAVYKLSETDTLHRGFFVVYAFSADMERLLLTVNQGSAEYSDAHGMKEALARAAAIRDAIIGMVDPDGFRAGPVDLGSRSSVSRFQGTGCMFSIEYRTRELPPDDVLLSDLSKAKGLYLEALRAKDAAVSAADGCLPRWG